MHIPRTITYYSVSESDGACRERWKVYEFADKWWCLMGFQSKRINKRTILWVEIIK